MAGEIISENLGLILLAVAIFMISIAIMYSYHGATAEGGWAMIMRGGGGFDIF